MSAHANAILNGPGGPRHPEPENLVLYAMQLLSTEESAMVAEHLASCSECRSECARIYGDLALCASTVDLQSPPETSRQRLMQQVAREKKIIPIARARTQIETQAQAEAAPPSKPAFASFGRSASILSIEDRPHRRVSRILLGVAGWAAAAALAVAVFLAHKDREALRTTIATQNGELQRLTIDAASAHELMDALTDPKAVRVSLSAKPQPKAQPAGGVTYNPQKGKLIFLASNLDPLQAYKTYELWVIPADGSASIPAGTFHPDDQGNASVIMPDLPKGIAAKAFGVTIETDGGSATPTPPIIISGS